MCAIQHIASDLFQILNPEQVSQLMTDIIRNVEQIVQFSPTYLRLLLACFKWDKDALIEYYFEHGKKRTFGQAQIVDGTELSGQFLKSFYQTFCYCFADGLQ